MSGRAEPRRGAASVARTLDLSNGKLLTRGIRKRRSAPIMGYCGLNGSFKTATMIRDTLPSLALGRRVLSTVEILDPDTGRPHPLYIPFRSWEQLHEFHDGDVLLDEVTGIMDAREQGMPKHVRRLLPQMRRANVLVRWSGISWDNADRRLRQLTQAVAMCRGFLPAGQNDRGGAVDVLAMWAPKRLAFVTTYDAQTLQSVDDVSQLSQEPTKKRRARVLNRELWWGPGSPTFSCYDTLAPVAPVSNDCPVCGGRRPDVSCRRPEEHAAEWANSLAALSALTSAGGLELPELAEPGPDHAAPFVAL